MFCDTAQNRSQIVTRAVTGSERRLPFIHPDLKFTQHALQPANTSRPGGNE